MKVSSLVFLSSIVTFNLYSMQKSPQAQTQADVEFQQTCDALPPIIDIRLSTVTTSGFLDAPLHMAKESTEDFVYRALKTPEAIAHYQKMYAYFIRELMSNTTPLEPSTAKGSAASNK